MRFATAVVLAVAFVAASVTSACKDEAEAPSAAPTAASTIPMPRASVPPEPASTVPADWASLDAGTMSLAVPGRYVGGDPADERTLTAMSALGGNCAAEAAIVASVREQYELMAVDSASCDGEAARTVRVLRVSSRASSPGDFAEEYVASLGAGGALVDFDVGSISGLPAAVMLLRREGVPVLTQAAYAVNDAGSWIVVVGAAAESDFDAAKPEFDAIAATLRVE